MWITELAMKTKTADTSNGSQSAVSAVIVVTSLVYFFDTIASTVSATLRADSGVSAVA
jgi:hypothetical protein